MAAVTSGENALFSKIHHRIDMHDHQVLVPLLFNMLRHLFSATFSVDHLFHQGRDA